MEVLDIDWKNIDSKFVKDDFYEDIRAPKWLDFLAPEEPIDDDAWFCKPDCEHPKNAANLVKSPSVPSHKVRRLGSARSTTPLSVSSISPLRERTASNLNGKKTRTPLSASVTSLYELKSKKNASENLKISSSLDKKYVVNSKLQSASSKHRAHSENDNPNRPRSVSATPTGGRTLKVQGKKSSISSPAKVSRQNSAVKAVQSPASSQKKGDVKQGIHNVSTASTPVTTPVQSTRQAANKTPANGRKIPSAKSGSALKETFSARTLFGKTTGKEIISQLSELCSELKKFALSSAQADSSVAKQSKKPCKHPSNVDKSKVEPQDTTGNCSELGGSVLSSSSGCPSENSPQNDFEDDNVTTTSRAVDPEKGIMSNPRQKAGLRHRINTAAARTLPKSNEHRKRTNDGKKKENVSSQQQEVDEKNHVGAHMEGILRETLANTPKNSVAYDDHKDDANNLQKVENRKDFNESNPHSFSGPILCQQHDIAVHSGYSELQNNEGCSNRQRNIVKETHKKSLHAKIFSPNSWKKRKDDGIDQRADCSKKDNCKPDQKVQSCPPSPQKFSRLSQASSPSTEGKKSKTTPVQPFRLRTMERGILRELEFSKKMGRSSASTDNIFASPESKLFLSDVFWFLKRCA